MTRFQIAPVHLENSMAQRPVVRLRDGSLSQVEDFLVVEEPLEIRVNNEPFTVTMRTPGYDFELTRGLLLTEGLIQSEADIGQIRYCDTGEAGEAEIENIVTVRLTRPIENHGRWQRTLMSGTSCGLCGKSAIDAVAIQGAPLPDTDGFAADILLQFPHEMRRQQELFSFTGGLHSVAIFTNTGECLAAFEDIGRHNAADKAIGRGVAEGWLPWQPHQPPLALLVSGRASFEITQKALMARIPVVCAVSAASTLAAELATASNQTLIGFLRDTSMTIYSGHSRIM